MRIVANHLLEGFDETENPEKSQEFMEDVNEAVDTAISEVMEKHGIKSEILSQLAGVCNKHRVLIPKPDLMLGVRKINELPTMNEQKILNKYWAILTRDQEMYHPEDPNFQ